jgi:hypothetical protein
MTVHVSGERIDAVLAQLRAEEPLEHDASQRALLRYEIAHLEESRGDAKAAASEYLAAFELAPEFREPLHALARMMLSRTSDDRSTSKLLETLVGAAGDPAEATTALWELAAYRAEVQGDLAGARECLERALAADPSHVASWLSLEMVAAKAGDVAARLRAVEARAQLATDPTVQGTLLIEMARLFGDLGDSVRSLALLEQAAKLDGRARYRALLALEGVVRETRDVELQAIVLERQAELVVAALADPVRGDRDGVPRNVRLVAHAVDAWLRAAELRRRNGDAWGATTALNAAAARIAGDPLIVRMQIAAADAASDSALALQIAMDAVEGGAGGAAGAALWVRIGLAAESEGRHADAAEAYAKALVLDPTNAVAEAQRLPALLVMDDGTPLARAYETYARRATGEEAQPLWLVVAFAWGARNGNAVEAQRALDACIQAGMTAADAASYARCFAAIASNWPWYEEATARALAHATDPRSRAVLGFELGRARLLRDDAEGAEAAFSDAVAGDGATAWLGRVLAAYTGSPLRPRARAVARVAELPSDADLGRGLLCVASWLALREGAPARAVEWLSKEHERAPQDVVVAMLLAEALRRHDPGAAARVVARHAAEVTEPALAGSLFIEAGLLHWRAGNRSDAVAAFESAVEPAPLAARRALAWALRAAAPDERAVRRRVAELEEDGDTDRAVGALERFGLGVLEKGGEADAWAALEQLDDLDPGGDIALATALARLLWASESIEDGPFATALERIEPLGGGAARLVRAERYRRARFLEDDAKTALGAARAWAKDEPALYTALAWLSAAAAAKDSASEVDARRAVARHLEGEPRVQVLASAAVVATVEGHADAIGIFDVDSSAARLLNLELALPGVSPARRASALGRLGDALGDDARRQAARLGAWSELARGAFERAKDAFFGLCREDVSDLAAWEGLRAAAEGLDDHVTQGAALLQIGSLVRDDREGAELLERAGITLLERTAAHAEAEEAFSKALARDPKRALSFEKLFRRLRQRNEDELLLAMIAKRIAVTDDTAELTRMYWERARVQRRRGDIPGALAALENVTELEADHVGALALLGEIRINKARSYVEAGKDAKKEFAEAAPVLARLAATATAPEQQRRVSAVAAADVYEKQLDQGETAFAVLMRLHADGLSTLAVRERIARLAGRLGKWAEAASSLEELMEQRDSSSGRADAARLAMAIHRDKLKASQGAERAAARVLQEEPDDPDAIEVVLRAPLESLRPLVLNQGRAALERSLAAHPMDARRLRVLGELVGSAGHFDAQRAVLGALSAVVLPDEAMRQTLLRLDTRVSQVPAIALDDRALGTICDPEDEGPVAELFAVIAEVVSTALGPSLRSEGIGKKDRLEPGDPLRVEVARWMGAVGFDDFQLYLGGRRRNGVSGVASDIPTIIVGTEFQTPLDAASRAAVAREAFALRRGITAVLHNDDHTIASVVASVSNEVGVSMTSPPYAIFKEVDRAIRNSMNRKIRKTAAELCAQIVETGADTATWLAAARRSIDRMSLVAAGDAATVIDAVIGSRGTPGRATFQSDTRAKSLLRFAVSPEYLQLRRRLGMGMS